MKEYIVLKRGGVKFAIEISNGDYQKEVDKLRLDGFTICSESINAKSGRDAINAYHSKFDISSFEVKENVPLTTYNLLFLRANSLSRRVYLGLCFIFGTLIGLSFMGFVSSISYLSEKIQSPLGLSLISLILFSIFWLSLAMSVARWKNIGHSGIEYLFTIVFVIVMDLLYSSDIGIGILSIIFTLYVMLMPTDFVKLSRKPGKGYYEYNHIKQME